jgi:hypothetical protein
LLRANGEPNLMRVVSLVRRDLIGRALEVVERPWKDVRFGVRRSVSEDLFMEWKFLSTYHTGGG